MGDYQKMRDASHRDWVKPSLILQQLVYSEYPYSDKIFSKFLAATSALYRRSMDSMSLSLSFWWGVSCWGSHGRTVNLLKPTRPSLNDRREPSQDTGRHWERLVCLDVAQWGSCRFWSITLARVKVEEEQPNYSSVGQSHLWGRIHVFAYRKDAFKFIRRSVGTKRRSSY